jgi:hypothetical protein
MIEVKLADKDIEIMTRAVRNYLVDVSTVLGDRHARVIEIEEVLWTLEGIGE